MVKRKTTFNDMAIMVQRGFEETAKKIEVGARFDEMDKRFDKIENMILIDYLRRIEKLERHVDELRDALALK
jgi:hypothetical protein